MLNKIKVNLENSLVDDLEALEGGALFPEELGVGRHRSRWDSTDVGVVTAIGDVEDRPIHVRVEHGSDHGQVGQVGSSC